MKWWPSRVTPRVTPEQVTPVWWVVRWGHAVWGPDRVWWVSEGFPFPEIGVELPCSEFGEPSQIRQKVFRGKRQTFCHHWPTSQRKPVISFSWKMTKNCHAYVRIVFCKKLKWEQERHIIWLRCFCCLSTAAHTQSSLFSVDRIPECVWTVPDGWTFMCVPCSVVTGTPGPLPEPAPLYMYSC